MTILHYFAIQTVPHLKSKILRCYFLLHGALTAECDAQNMLT